MMWTFELKPCVSAVKLNAERAADDLYIYIYTIVACAFKDEIEGKNFFHGFSKINYKLFTYSEVGVIAL